MNFTQQRIQEFIIEEALKEQEKIDHAAMIDERNAMLVDPNTDYGDKFEAVMVDLLSGRHTSQVEPQDPGLYREPTDNGEENTTEDF